MPIENKAGQNETAKWYKPILSTNGEERRFANDGIAFWCVKSTQGRTDKAFRDGIQGKKFTCVIATTNLSKINGIDEQGGRVLYNGSLRQVSYAQLNENGSAMFIALE